MKHFRVICSSKDNLIVHTEVSFLFHFSESIHQIDSNLATPPPPPATAATAVASKWGRCLILLCGLNSSFATFLSEFNGNLLTNIAWNLLYRVQMRASKSLLVLKGIWILSFNLKKNMVFKLPKSKCWVKNVFHSVTRTRQVDNKFPCETKFNYNLIKLCTSLQSATKTYREKKPAISSFIGCAALERAIRISKILIRWVTSIRQQCLKYVSLAFYALGINYFPYHCFDGTMVITEMCNASS